MPHRDYRTADERMADALDHIGAVLTRIADALEKANELAEWKTS